MIPPAVEHQCLCKSGLIVIDIPLALICRQDRPLLNIPQTFPIHKELKPIVELITNEVTTNPNSSSIYYLYYYLYSKVIENRSTQSLRYIQDHYDEPITVSFLAEMENYNVTYYNAWFKQQTGMSPAQYLRQVPDGKSTGTAKRHRYGYRGCCHAGRIQQPFCFHSRFQGCGWYVPTGISNQLQPDTERFPPQWHKQVKFENTKIDSQPTKGSPFVKNGLLFVELSAYKTTINRILSPFKFLARIRPLWAMTMDRAKDRPTP